MIAFVDVAGDQAGAVGVGARNENCRHAHDVGRQSRGDQFLYELPCVGTRTLPPICPHFFAEAS